MAAITKTLIDSSKLPGTWSQGYNNPKAAKWKLKL